MKKIALIIVLSLTLVACGNDKSSKPDSDSVQVVAAAKQLANAFQSKNAQQICRLTNDSRSTCITDTKKVIKQAPQVIKTSQQLFDSVTTADINFSDDKRVAWIIILGSPVFLTNDTSWEFVAAPDVDKKIPSDVQRLVTSQLGEK